LQMNHADDGSNVIEPGWNKVARRRRRPNGDESRNLRGSKMTQAGTRKKSRASNGTVPFDG
jgi:hypothetical protein